MQTVEMHFSNAIQEHSLFNQAALLLIQEITELAPDDICNRCTELTTLQQELADNQNHLFTLMEFVGPEILNTSFVGEFQRALQQSILTCDALHAAVLDYKKALISCPT